MADPFSHLFPPSLSLTTKSSSQVSITVHIFFFLLHHLFGISSSTFNKSVISLCLPFDDSYLFSLYESILIRVFKILVKLVLKKSTFSNLIKTQLHQTPYFISLFYFLIYFYYFAFIYLYFHNSQNTFFFHFP